MPIPFLIPIVVALGVSIVLALAFWYQILDWAQDSLFPWVKRNIPLIEGVVKEAFIAVDKVATPIRKTIRQAWEKLRDFLLKQVVKIEIKSSSELIKRVTSWVIKVLESGKKVPVKVETEEEVNWDELPEEVRKEFLSKGESETEIDVTEIRDDEIDQMDMSA
ncbi:hypothetical protein [Okeania sp. KiyG1]|uniref:hypothetical protein n=1 Tax=Okeania sp. KiyG1 TaxID=2720165 RepID=UPI0019217A2B|nr:hypothetical protein [Okeania sp. KiyG1]GGA18112.1 hypothetical protein CYANOKiyG1_32440 [Okeania sp. KiyG1]